jgi:molybdate transport system substrate-binding protein
MRQRFYRTAILALWWMPLTTAANADAAKTPVVTVFAAASLTEVLEDIGKKFTDEFGTKVEFSFAATSMLARQVESGAHADVFFSADQEWMDYLDQRGLVQRSSRHNVLGNRLALVAGADSTLQLQIGPRFPLLAALQGGRLAVADPDSVPAGRYARSALTSLGVWNDVADRLARAENVRGALAFVARGEAPLGVVYETDALIDRHVRVVSLFPEDSHLPILYPVALTTAAGAPARAFVDYLDGSVGRAVFRKFGFAVVRR